ncbi:MAG: amino acid adenylation domain-containing protein [Ruminococcaceae bacterium]|nr:amino acid adenylation domain-containing protein [Oscillospiraceae bacterium]
MYHSSDGQRFPLSLSQMNIWNLEHALRGTSVNNISTTVRIDGRLDFPALQKCLGLILESDASLRTRLVEEDGRILQYHAPYEAEEFPVYDFSSTGSDGVSNWENAVTREPIPLFGGPLYRFILFKDGEQGGGILVKLHHIIADGWTQIMLCNKIACVYLDLLAGREPQLPEAPDYELHVREEQEYLASKAYLRDEKYWKDIVRMAGEPSVLKSVSSASVSPVGRRVSFTLPDVLNHAIYTYCEEKRVAPFAVFYMALAIYFKRIGGADPFTIGVPIFNRTNYTFKQSTGMFVTTLPFFNEIDSAWSLNEFNNVLTERWLELLRHQRYPFTSITELTDGGRLFHIALSYQDSKIYESRDASVTFSGRWHYCGYQAEQLTIHLTNLTNHQRYAVDYDYLAQFFSEEEIGALHRNLCHILAEALAEPDRPIHRLNVLSLEQKEELLYTFNRTERYLKEQSLYEALIENNARHPNRAALIYGGERMSYGALFQRGMAFASRLAALKPDGEVLIAILLPRSFDLIAAMVGTLQMGGAFLLLSPSLPDERIRRILEQSGASALVTLRENRKRIPEETLPVLYSDEITVTFPEPIRNEIPEGVLPGDRLAYVVYTSGSTGEPKGVEITQRSVLNLAQEMENVYGQGAVLSVCNIGFDAFMLESIAALLNGKTIVLPQDGETDSPERLASLMNGYAVDFLATTPSRLSALLNHECFRRVMWRMSAIVCGGEPFPAELLKKLKACTKARIYNQYGPSETTVAVSMKEMSAADRITIGTPLGNCRLYVLDPWMNPLPIGGSGKLFVGGTCVGRGYRGRPDLSEAVFRRNPFVYNDRIYDTGDMAYWTPEGEIVLTGRADRQIKLRGLRIELSEISSCLESFPGVTAAHARLCEIGGQPVLGAYYSSANELRESDLLAHAATYLPTYMIPAFLMRVPEFRVTANGKIDESLLPMPDRKRTESGGATECARRVTEIFGEVLGCGDLSPESDYFLSGGDSLNMMSCLIRLEKSFGVRLRPGDLYACRTASRLAERIDTLRGVTSAAAPTAHTLRKTAKQSRYPLMPLQQGIYIQSVLDPSGLTYNMPGAFRLAEEPDRARLTRAFENIIRQDPIFRTSFVQHADGVYAVIADEVPFTLEEITASSFEDAGAQFLRPFDLTAAPLLRGAVWQSPEGDWYLLMDSHHIIGDGMSTPLVLQRLDQAYTGTESAAEWDFYDYISARQGESEEEKAADLQYWIKELADLPEPLVLPGDYPRAKEFDYAGGEWEHPLPDALCRSIGEFCAKSGLSEFVLFLSAYALLLSAVSGESDLVIGTPSAGRDYPGTDTVCGPFIQTLPLRLRLDPECTAEDWMKRVAGTVSGMLDHRQIGLEDIITALDLPRGAQNALYRVMLTQSPVDENAFRLGGKPMNFRAIPTGAVKMDMILEIARKEHSRTLRFSYARSIFAEETVAFWGRCLEQALRELIRGGDRKITPAALLSPADRETYWEEPLYRTTPFVNRPIHQMLKAKAAASPEETAVIWHGETVSFAAIEGRACAIARFLEESGIAAGSCVALCLKRTPDMIAAMYGVLKAGCAYLFLLDTFPEARLRSMLELSGAAAVLCGDSVPPVLAESMVLYPVLCLPAGYEDSYTDRPVMDDSLVNVLFTSGSTGQPKGVMLRHRSVSNLCSQMKSLLDPLDGRVLCSTNAVFDCFIVETLIALALGRTVVLADEEEMLLPWKLGQLITEYGAGITEMTPSRLWMCLGSEDFRRAARDIRIVLLGGEAVTRSLADKFLSCSDGILMNMYGPTEATVFTTMGPVRADEPITIGAPLQNTRTYVLDENRNPVLPTGCGELYIAGECLSAGYISCPDMTQASFTDDPFFPGQKMYKSGDLVRLRTDGRFDYIGRRDQQIKLNGQRVELSEISGALEQIDGIRQAAADALRHENGTQELFAFCVCAENAPTDEEILLRLGETLPPYMVPSRLIRIGAMPLTSTGKIDRQTLQKWAALPPSDKSADAQKDVPAEIPAEIHEEIPAEVTVPGSEAYVRGIWSQVLSHSDPDPEISFFKQGGTSLAALTVLSHYYNDHMEMSLAEFYENPTVRAQAALLSRGRNSGDKTQEAADGENAPDGEEDRQTVLLTGATGFFGSHLLQALYEENRSRIICLIRGGDRTRLHRMLAFYFGEETASAMTADTDHLRVLDGDLTKERLGLGEDAYAELAGSVREIYHCAADVRHYAADDSLHRQINAEGTGRLLALAREADAAFYHMSTCSVSGDVMKDGSRGVRFTEEDLDIGQIWERNVYVRTKFQAEQLVTAAMEQGLRARIFRLGRLVGRMSDGKFQINPEENAFWLFMRGMMQLGQIPLSAAEISLDLMPVDLAVQQVMTLRHAPGPVFHIMNGNPPTLAEILQAISGSAKTVEDHVFRQALSRENAGMDPTQTALVINNWLQLKAVRDGITVDCSRTQAALKALGFDTPSFSPATVLRAFKNEV